MSDEEQEVEIEVRTADDRQREEPSDFVRHMRNSFDAFGKQWSSLIPQEFWEYGEESRKEFLLAMRTLVDSAIDNLEKGTAPREGGSTRGRTKARVQVED